MYSSWAYGYIVGITQSMSLHDTINILTPYLLAHQGSPGWGRWVAPTTSRLEVCVF